MQNHNLYFLKNPVNVKIHTGFLFFVALPFASPLFPAFQQIKNKNEEDLS